jgi:hypothetical protein
MTSPKAIGRNDPCPCGSGKKFKRCCLEQRDASYNLWAEQRDACDRLTGDMMRFVSRNFGERFEEAWQDFNMTDLPLPPDEANSERQIFMPYFLFHWDPRRPRSKNGAGGIVGMVTRLYTLEKAGSLSEMDRLILEQAAMQPVSFHEVLSTEPGEGIALRDVLLGTETEVIERSASRSVRRGDILYAQVWNIREISILGCTAPTCIPPKCKAEVIALRKKLRRKIAKQNRDLEAQDLVRYTDEIRLAYLTIRDALYRPPQFSNTDGEPLVFYTLTFRIASAQVALDALAPLAAGRTKEELLGGAKIGETGRLRSVTFEWLKRGNAKISSWENTILGSINISDHSLVAEVNSEKRATRLRSEIEKRLGILVTHVSTIAHALDEMLAKSPKLDKSKSKIDDEILRDPEVRKRLEQTVQKHAESWVHEKIPILGGRTPMQAVNDPDGREIVESLLLEWERRATQSNDVHDIHPDFSALRKALNLVVSAF